MRANSWIKLAVASVMASSLLISPIAALADDSGNDSGSNGNSGHDGGLSWNGGLPTKDIYTPRPASGYATPGSYGGTSPLTYHGGTSLVSGTPNAGVQTGSPKVYLVFFGSNWGTQSTDGSGNLTFSADPKGLAPYLQRFIKGLGTAGDNWSGVVTQYCEQVANGAQGCGANDLATRVGYPAGGMFAGVWYDNSKPVSTTKVTTDPGYVTQKTLSAEAMAAAAHFGNVSQASNRNVQYVIVSPTGTYPDGFNNGGGFCAYHSYATDAIAGTNTGVQGTLTFTNLPYIPDAGASCGANYVNATDGNGVYGSLDGVSIVEGHEIAETVTDPYLSGYFDRYGYENGDKCAWIRPGSIGGAANLTFGTGAFAMQGTWSNSLVACSLGSALTLASAVSTAPGTNSTTKLATGGAYPYSASSNTPLPAGVTILADGTVSVASTVAPSTGSYNITVTDAAGTVRTSAVTITVTAPKATTLTLVASATSATTTTSVTFTATLSAGTPVVGAVITFQDGTTTLVTATTSSTGVATWKKTFSTKGSHVITARYAGSTSYAASTSPSVTVTVN